MTDATTTDALAPTLWWHGGPSGLTEILPPSVTGVKPARDYMAEDVEAHVRTDVVYCVDSVAWAAVFAVLSSKAPCVYLVTPWLPWLPDPDLVSHAAGLQSIMCPTASVVEAVPLDHATRRFWLAQAHLVVARHGFALNHRDEERAIVDLALNRMLHP